MRRALIAAVAALTLSGTPAFAEEAVTTGADLLPSCREFAEGRYESRGFRTGICVGAVYSTLTLLPNICAPANSTLVQAVKVVSNYMLRHSEQLHMDITLLSVYALTEAWPCKKEP
jgi:Rap1a immunity proteins